MLIQSDTKTNLARQEAIIAKWKKQNGWKDTAIVNANPKSTPFVISSNKSKSASQAKQKSEPIHVNRPKLETNQQKQTEYLEKYNAQVAGNLDTDYYYFVCDGKARRRKRKLSTPKPLAYQPFTGEYGELQGTNLKQRLINLLENHDYIDVDSLIKEHDLNRQALLQEAKSLEKSEMLKIIKHGKAVAYLERVA